MKCILYVYLITIYLLCSHAAEIVSASQEHTLVKRIQKFEQELKQLQKKLNIPGMSIAVLQQQEVIYAKGFGLADIENKIAATEHTPYHIASLTKPFTAVLVMKLVEDERLNLDDRMSDILKEADFRVNDMSVHGYANLCETLKPLIHYKGDTHTLTVRHHLTHTAHGIPGEKYRYSGYLFGLLTEVLETVSQKRFEQLLVDEIISPLEMTATVPNMSDQRQQHILSIRAKPYKIDEAGVPMFSRYPGRIRASAGMVSTVVDLAKFDIALDKNQLLSEDSMNAMYTPARSNKGEALPYGLGWFIQTYGDAHFIWHYGWQPDAYSSLILKVLEKETTFILLANSDGASAPFDLGQGNVLNSPFATSFIETFTQIDISTEQQIEK